MYALLRPLLFLLPPERAHRFTFLLLEVAARIPGLLRLIGGGVPPKSAALDLMGLHFPSPVGLAAGMDKDARHVDAFARLGFGFIEVGTLTPRPQAGNPRPRLFRLPKDRALINRMGFNNGGVEVAAIRLRERRPGVIVGGNIGKNKDTPNERAAADYLACLEALHDVVDYFVVNVSSPNTPGLRELQEKGPLLDLLKLLHGRSMAKAGAAPVKPVLLKIAPDLTDAQIDDVCDVVKASGIAGVIATNTTVSRDGLHTPAEEVTSMGAGGLSGAPLRDRSTAVIRLLRERLPRPLVIIGVGGIDSVESAMEKLAAGADLIQVYTGLIYAGPTLPGAINRAFAAGRGKA